MPSDALLGNDTWDAFAAGAFLSIGPGLGVLSASRGMATLLNARQAVVMTGGGLGGAIGVCGAAAVLVKTEAKDLPEKILPRAQEIAGNLTPVYVGLAVAGALAYLLPGMLLASLTF